MTLSDHKNCGSQGSAGSTQKSATASKMAAVDSRSDGQSSATGSENSALQCITLFSNNNEDPDCGTFGEAGITKGGPAQNSTPEDVPFDMVAPVTPSVERQEPQDAPLYDVQADVASMAPTQPAVLESKFSDDVFDGLEDEPSDASDWYSKTTMEAPVPQETKSSADISVLSESLSYLSEIVVSIQRAIVPSSLVGQLQKVHEGDAPSLDETFGSGSAEDQKLKKGVGGSQLTISDGESIMETAVSFLSEKMKSQNSGKSKSPETPQVQEDSLPRVEQEQAAASESDASFMDFVDAHISALVKDCDCATVGTKPSPSYNWGEAQTALLSPFVIDDGAMHGMLDVLEREIEHTRTPGAIEVIESVGSE